MKVSIVIPNCNGEEILRKNLPRVLSAAPDCETIVIDDASSDNSISEIRKYKEIKLLTNKENKGFSSTVNKGVNAAKGDIVVLLNTDVYPENNFLKPLLRHFSDSMVFAVGSLDKSIENGKVVLRGRGIGKWQKGFLVHGRGEIDKSNTLWVSGESAAFRRQIWKKLGGFNELYNPFYWEDIDLCYRGLKSGYKVLFEKNSVVYHEHEKGAIKKKYAESAVKRIVYRNQIIFVWENATDLSIQFFHVLYLPYHLIRAIISADVAFILGFLDALILLPKIIKSSFKAQKNFVKSDREVIGDLEK